MIKTLLKEIRASLPWNKRINQLEIELETLRSKIEYGEERQARVNDRSDFLIGQIENHISNDKDYLELDGLIAKLRKELTRVANAQTSLKNKVDAVKAPDQKLLNKADLEHIISHVSKVMIEAQQSSSSAQEEPVVSCCLSAAERSRAIKIIESISVRANNTNKVCFGYANIGAVYRPIVDQFTAIWQLRKAVKGGMKHGQAMSFLLENIGGLMDLPKIESFRSVDDKAELELSILSKESLLLVEKFLDENWITLKNQWVQKYETHEKGKAYDQALMRELKRVSDEHQLTTQKDRAKGLKIHSDLKDRFGNEWRPNRLSVEEAYLKARYDFSIRKRKARDLTAEEVDTVIAMSKAGFENLEIAKQLKTSQASIGGYVSDARKRGELEEVNV